MSITEHRSNDLVTLGIGLVCAAVFTCLGGFIEVMQIALQSPLSLVLLILSIPLFLLGLLAENIGGRNL